MKSMKIHTLELNEESYSGREGEMESWEKETQTELKLKMKDLES